MFEEADFFRKFGAQILCVKKAMRKFFLLKILSKAVEKLVMLVWKEFVKA